MFLNTYIIINKNIFNILMKQKNIYITTTIVPTIDENNVLKQTCFNFIKVSSRL